MKTDTVKVIINGKLVVKETLDEDCTTSLLYIENTDFATSQAEGLTESENLIETQKRAADTYFETWLETLVELKELDHSAPEAWCSAHNLPYSLVIAIMAATFNQTAASVPDPHPGDAAAADDLFSLARAQLGI